MAVLAYAPAPQSQGWQAGRHLHPANLAQPEHKLYCCPAWSMLATPEGMLGCTGWPAVQYHAQLPNYGYTRRPSRCPARCRSTWQNPVHAEGQKRKGILRNCFCLPMRAMSRLTASTPGVVRDAPLVCHDRRPKEGGHALAGRVGLHVAAQRAGCPPAKSLVNRCALPPLPTCFAEHIQSACRVWLVRLPD